MKVIGGVKNLNGYVKWIIPSLVATVLVLSAIVGQAGINSNEERAIRIEKRLERAEVKVGGHEIHIATDTLISRQTCEKLAKIELKLTSIENRLITIERLLH